MEEEKKLYPFKLVPVEDMSDEIWHLADLGFPDSMVRNGWLASNTLSEIMEMYMDRVVGEGVFAAYGRQFPVLMKSLKGTRRTPLLVHPDDEIAAQRFDFLGKAKLWYVVSARPGSKLFLGFRRDVSSEEFYRACQDGSVEDLLHVVEPKAGDSFFIAPGTVHAAGEGVSIAEVAESSPLDFRLYDWGRKAGEVDPFDAELTLEAAFDFIDYRAWQPQAPRPEGSQGTVRLTDNPEFIATRIRLTEPLHIFCEQFGSFVAYLCLAGEASVQVPAGMPGGEASMDNYGIGAGEALLVPAEVPDFYLVPRAEGTLLLEAVVERHEVPEDFPGRSGDRLLN
ncbi:MAG: class I mannose-6-phosphate isomerase [Bacteroidales bacterium]|nr:class I mannose-6-phosphate isomerase [Bacteroidales bacterium]